MKKLFLGKYHRLMKCSSTARTFSILAIDHRTSLMRALKERSTEDVGDQILIDFKKEIVDHVGGQADAILIDPEYGAPQCIASGSSGDAAKMILSIERSGYSGEPNARCSEVLDGWDVEKSSRIGADAIKLLVYYHPRSKTANDIESLVESVAKKCAELDIAFFLEPLTYSLDPNEKKVLGDERRSVIIETAERLSSLGADVMKMEFPADVTSHPDKSYWQEACQALSSAISIPWVLLSAAVDYEGFVAQVQTACEQGASGIAVGRAVWKEAVEMDPGDRVDFLKNTANRRMRDLNKICQQTAKPWTDFYTPPQIGGNWYADY